MQCQSLSSVQKADIDFLCAEMLASRSLRGVNRKRAQISGCIFLRAILNRMQIKMWRHYTIHSQARLSQLLSHTIPDLLMELFYTQIVQCFLMHFANSKTVHTTEINIQALIATLLSACL